MSSLTMQKIALVSVCLASAGYGREVQILEKPLKYGPAHSMKVLEKFLLAFNPAAAYVSNPILVHRLGHRKAVSSTSAPPASHGAVVTAANDRGSGAWRSSRARSTVPHMQEKIPNNPKILAETLTDALSFALSDGLRRIEVTMPDGLCLYGEMNAKQKIGDPDKKMPEMVIRQADRDVAYLVSEQLGAFGDSVVCVLPSKSMQVAEREWAQGRLATRLVSSLDKLLPKGTKGGGAGFGGGRKAKIRVLIVPRADKSVIKKMQPIIEPLGDEVIVILVNPKKLRSGKNRAGYTPAFVLQDNPHPDWKGGMLYRAYPRQWVLGVAGNKGEASISEKSDERPSLKQLEIGFKRIKETKGIWNRISGGFDGLYGAAAALEPRVSDEDEFESDEQDDKETAATR
mmetsp:Transcript_151574/g.264098  ORF Transcript_151574/g.264098 Transcript_151574/m.264098 type:complete len:400 (-) Transcript_151574:179-1378(-)